jgi:hypothetical protein
MVDEKAATTKPAKIEPPPKVLGLAAESSDPAVHQVLAELGTAQSNGDDKAVQALTEKLAGLGYK